MSNRPTSARRCTDAPPRRLATAIELLAVQHKSQHNERGAAAAPKKFLDRWPAPPRRRCRHRDVRRETPPPGRAALTHAKTAGTMAETASEIKLFGKWTYDDVEVNDISLEDYIAVKGKHSVYLPHTAGRYQKKRFRKALCPITERLACALMRKGRNNGKKLKAVRVVQSTLDIVHLLTDQNPMQVLVQAIIQAGPREDSTRVGSAGVVRRQAVDMSPFRRSTWPSTYSARARERRPSAT